MNTKIRKACFETNSSSCHSLTITESTKLNDIPIPDENGNIMLQSGEFGWEQDEHFDFEIKAAYVIVYIRDWSGKNQERFREIFETLLKETTQCEEILYEKGFWENEGWDNGYIDHQSVEDADLDFLFEDVGELRKLLFNNESYIETDNDNH